MRGKRGKRLVIRPRPGVERLDVAPLLYWSSALSLLYGPPALILAAVQRASTGGEWFCKLSRGKIHAPKIHLDASCTVTFTCLAPRLLLCCRFSSTPSSSSSVPLPVSVPRLVPVPRFPLSQFPVSGFGNKCRSSSSAIVLAVMGGSALNLAHGPGSVHVASRQFCPSTVGVCGSVPTWSSSSVLAFVLSFCCIVWRP